MPVSLEVASVATKARCNCMIFPLRLSRYRRSTTECACFARSCAESSSLEEPLWPRFVRTFLSRSSLGLGIDSREFEREVFRTILEGNTVFVSVVRHGVELQSSISARLVNCTQAGSGPHRWGLHSPDCLRSPQPKESFRDRSGSSLIG